MVGEVTSELREGVVGEGEMPSEFRRVNWGASIVGPFWAASFRLPRIVIAYSVLIIGYLVAANGVLYLAPSAFTRVTAVLNAASFPVIAIGGVVFGLLANRYLWRVQAANLALPSGRKPPIPLRRLRKSNRFWFAVATVLCVLSVFGLIGSLAYEPANAFGTVPRVFGSLSLPLLYGYDLWLWSRSKAAS